MAWDPWGDERRIREMQEYERRVKEQERKYWEMLQTQQLQQTWPQQNPFSSGGLLSGGLLNGLAGAIGALGVEPASNAIDAKIVDALKAAEPRVVTRRIADGITMITAWRAWGVTNNAGEWRLKALGKNHIWEPKKRLEATCEASKQHPAPQKECTCGVWSFKTLDVLIPALNAYTVKVFGNVSLWGRIIETENGFRAQFAYPKELWLLDDAMEELGFIYGVPIRTIEKEKSKR